MSNAVTSTFRTVSIEDAKCSSEADKEKILAIIETSFITFKAFDRHISNLLVQVSPHIPSHQIHRGLAASVRSRLGVVCGTLLHFHSISCLREQLFVWSPPSFLHRRCRLRVPSMVARPSKTD